MKWVIPTWGLNPPGYLDGYTDATAVFIAASCDDPLAQTLANAMGIAYLRPGSTEGVGDLSDVEEIATGWRSVHLVNVWVGFMK